MFFAFNHRMKNYLIIGYGWLGKALAETLKNKQASVWATSSDNQKLNDIKTAGFSALRLEKNRGILSWAEDELPLLHFDAVIVTLPPFEGALDSLSNLLQSLHVKSIVFTSSTGVYKDASTLVNESSSINEDHLVFQMEERIRSLQPLNYTVLRLSGHIGPNRHPVRFFLRHGRDIPNGQAPINLIHQKDIIASILVTMNESQGNSVYNVCWPEHPTKENYYGAISLKLGGKKLVFLKGNQGKIIEGSKITNETNFNYRFSIDEIDDLDLRKDNI